MERRTAQKLLIFVAVFYAAVAILAVCILNLSGSVFKDRGGINLWEYIRGVKDGEDFIVEDTSSIVDTQSKIEGLEGLDGDDDAPDSASVSYDTAVSEPATEEAAPEEAKPETVSEDAPAEEEHYYKFRSNNTDSILRMRETPGEDGRVIYELLPGSTGCVTEIGDEWSKVSAYGNEGYCANEYLTMTEVSKEEYDELMKGAETDAAGQSGNTGGTKKTGDTGGGTAAAPAGTDVTAPAALPATMPAATPDVNTGVTENEDP